MNWLAKLHCKFLNSSTDLADDIYRARDENLTNAIVVSSDLSDVYVLIPIILLVLAHDNYRASDGKKCKAILVSSDSSDV